MSRTAYRFEDEHNKSLQLSAWAGFSKEVASSRQEQVLNLDAAGQLNSMLAMINFGCNIAVQPITKSRN